jgi:hypothetical protein
VPSLTPMKVLVVVEKYSEASRICRSSMKKEVASAGFNFSTGTINTTLNNLYAGFIKVRLRRSPGKIIQIDFTVTYSLLTTRTPRY